MLCEICPKCKTYNYERYSTKCLYCGYELPTLKLARRVIREDPIVSKWASQYKFLKTARLFCFIGYPLLLVYLFILLPSKGYNTSFWTAFSVLCGVGMGIVAICLLCNTLHRKILNIINQKMIIQNSQLTTQKEST